VTESVRNLVLLHGWGMQAGVWDVLKPVLGTRYHIHTPDFYGEGAAPGGEPHTLEGMVAHLARTMPSPVVVCGWSLGALLTLAWARIAPQQVSAIALIGATPCFCRRSDWPHAMEPQMLNDFAAALTTDCGGTLRRFLALQVLGDRNARVAARRLRPHLVDCLGHGARWLRSGLDLLLESDLRPLLPEVRQPALVIHGDHDVLVPSAAGMVLAQALADGRFSPVTGAGHAPFASDPTTVAARLDEFFDGR